MAVENQPAAEAAENETPNAGTPIEGERQPETPANETPEAEEDETPPEVIALAREVGWTPRDQYKGPPEKWKDARQFILDGREIQSETARELRSIRAQLDTVARTTGSVVEQQVAERVADLRRQHAELVEAGDSDGALKVATEITRASAAAQPANTPSPDAADFAQRNANWFNKPGNEWATAKAVAVCNELAAQGYGPGDQLRICEQRMKAEHPTLFNKPANGYQHKPPAGVNQPSGRGAAPSNRAKGFADLPKAAQDIALDLEARLEVPKENYAKNYFANEARKA